MRHTTGLTLIEVLIALAIIGIALLAGIKASTQSIHSTSYLQDKIVAAWVGQYILNEALLNLLKLPKEQEQTLHKMHMLGRDWYWRAYQERTANYRIKKVSVDVYARDVEANGEDISPLSSVERYVYRKEAA